MQMCFWYIINADRFRLNMVHDTGQKPRLPLQGPSGSPEGVNKGLPLGPVLCGDDQLGLDTIVAGVVGQAANDAVCVVLDV